LSSGGRLLFFCSFSSRRVRLRFEFFFSLLRRPCGGSDRYFSHLFFGFLIPFSCGSLSARLLFLPNPVFLFDSPCSHSTVMSCVLIQLLPQVLVAVRFLSFFPAQFRKFLPFPPTPVAQTFLFSHVGIRPSHSSSSTWKVLASSGFLPWLWASCFSFPFCVPGL